MADKGGNGRAQSIPWSEEDKMGLVVRLLYHQGPIKWDGFEITTGHSQLAAGGVLHRLKKKYVGVAADGETAATKNDEAKPKATVKKGRKPAKKTEDLETEVKDDEADEESAADAPVEKKKRGRKPSKKAIESQELPKVTVTEASTDSKGKKRTQSKTPGAEPKSKKAKTEVEEA
ncbi:hypothetical protein FKW77_004070 [Venturia effusa]|uniref:Uncharacterized protein n=1 Tax=Venturia effusa TaxID=50376 RepID=A0A517LR36_9PEZI|nr:hypothetical protein FKW77_004070 [Venturia effusa]